MGLTRRNILIGSAAGGALIVAYAATPRRFALPLDPREGEHAFGAWIKIAGDGMVSIAVPQLEMGQGVSTLLPQIAAMELGADWRQVAVEPAPISGAYANAVLAARWAPLWMPFADSLAEGDDALLARSYAERSRFTATADGTALAAYEMPLRIAAASARELLARAAADRWGVDADRCVVAGGFVSNGHVGNEQRRLPFGALAEAAAGFDPPSRPVLRAEPPQERPSAFPPGTPPRFPRLDAPSKARGSAIFAGDVRLPDMLFAAIAHGPIGQSHLAAHDPTRLADVTGEVRMVKNDNWLAAAANNWWAAHRALEVIAPQFGFSNAAQSEEIDAALDRAVRKAKTHRIATIGDPDGAMGAKPTLVARYDVSPMLHAGLETASCTARLLNGKLELWLASQAPEAARRAAAKAVGLHARDVVVYPVLAGGSFDARLEHDHGVEAALIAQELGRPVQLTWSRWQEHIATRPRTPAAAVLWATTQAQGGQVIAWKTRIAAPATAREFGERLFGDADPVSAIAASSGKADPMAVEGALPVYGLGNVSVDHVPVSIALPTGRMRGNAHGYTAFFTESFIDELAHKAGREPLSYRMEMLGGDVRLATCLQRVSTLAQWNGGSDASGQGLACHRIGTIESGGRIAVIVTARRDTGGVRVEKISAAVDIGRIVNLDIARQQIEGGLIFGLGLTVGAGSTYVDGLPVLGRLADIGLPVLGNTPQIEVEFIDSQAQPADPGELGVAAIAPAVANALFSATGVRFRRLPLLEESE
ncbi:MAG: molybdopterin cofactor-binding domain-containing protein [Novosphingobium sp.]